MAKLLGIVLAVLVYAATAVAGDAIPPKYVGVWATDESVFNGMELIGGQAAYFDADGAGALAGAPLPVKKCDNDDCGSSVGVKFRASLEKDENLIRVTFTGMGPEVSVIGFRYDPQHQVLYALQPGREGGVAMKRRFSTLSNDARRALHETVSMP